MGQEKKLTFGAVEEVEERIAFANRRRPELLLNTVPVPSAAICVDTFDYIPKDEKFDANVSAFDRRASFGMPFLEHD